MVNTDTAIDLSLYIEASVWAFFGCAMFALTYIFLNENRLTGIHSTAKIYSKSLALLSGFACFACAFVAFIRAIGFDAVIEVIDNSSANQISGLKSYDLAFVSVGVWLFFMSHVVAHYNAFRDFTMHIYWISFTFWALDLFLLYHATSWWAMFILACIAAVVFVANILATIANSYVAFYYFDFWRWIMYSFYFGFQLTFAIVVLFSCPYNISQWGLMGQWFPEWVRWVLQVLATLVFTFVAIYSFMYRIPKSRDYHDFFPNDPAVPALNALIAQAQIVSGEDLEKTFGNTGGMAASRVVAGSGMNSQAAWIAPHA